MSYLSDRFLNDDTEIHDYEPGFSPTGDEVIKVEFELPAALGQCAKSKPASLVTADAKAVVADPPIALVAIDQTKPAVYQFQAVDSRNMLRPGGVLVFNPQGFRVNSETAISINNRLDAIYKAGFLYYKSEHNVRRFLDVEHLFKAATDEEIDTLFSDDIFEVDDLAELKGAATTALRRKLHIILTSDREIKPKAVQALSVRTGHKIEIRKGALVVPTDRDGFREFVRLLADDYLDSPQDHNRLYLVPSKKRVKPK